MSLLSSSTQNRNPEVEETFVATFISPNKRGRYNTLLASPSRRRKFLNRLNHNLDFIRALSQQITGNQHMLEGVARLLNQAGVRDSDLAYIISDVRELDMQVLPMRQAVEQALANDSGTVVCCSQGKIAYYRPESPENGFILKSAQAA